MNHEPATPADEVRADESAARQPGSPPETLPRAKFTYGALRGRWPGEIDDGFEEWVRKNRDGELTKEPPSWK